MRMNLVTNIDIFAATLAAGLIILSIAAYHRTAPPLGVRRRALLRSVRIASFLLLVLLVTNPVVLSTRVETRRPLVIVLLDHSRSMGIADVGSETRLAAAIDDARRLEREITSAGGDAVIIPFASTPASAPLSPDSSVSADGDGTDIRGALGILRDRYRAVPVSAVVLLSDGRVTRGMVSAGGSKFAPVFTVGYGDTARGANVAIEEVIAERIAFRGTSLPIEAVVRAAGYRESSVEVRLLEDGMLRQSVTLAVRRDDELLGAMLEYIPAREGHHYLTVEAVAGRAERHRDDNSETIRIDVRKDKVRILYIDQLADWNASFLGDLIRRSKRFEADIVHWSSGGGFVLGPQRIPWSFPRTIAELSQYDLVVISDDAELLSSRGNVERLTRYIEKGGSVLFIADEHSPLARSASVQLLAPVLPVRVAGSPRLEYGERLVAVSPEAAGDPFAAMIGSDERLEAVPPLPGSIAGLAASAGARVPLILEGRGGLEPFLAIDRRGDGLTAAVLAFPLWRWKLAGDAGAWMYESFFGGIVQYLAEGAKSPALSVEADRTVYRSGDRIRLTASVGDRRSFEAIRGEIRHAEKGSGEIVATVLFEPDARRRGVYRAALRGLLPGEYRALATEVQAGSGGASGSTTFSVEPISVEYLDTSRDNVFLGRIARETGGGSAERSELPSIVSTIDVRDRRVERTSSRELRGSLFVLGGIVALLGAEWIARKAWGLI